MHAQNGTRIQTATGGNPLLTPEKAISRSVGFTYSPHWIDDFSFGADYYEIDLTNEIGTVPAQYILNECYDKQSPQNCNLITLTGDAVTLIENIEQNIGGERTSGIDFERRLCASARRPSGISVSTTNWTFVRSFIEDLPSATSASGFQSVQELAYAANRVPQGQGHDESQLEHRQTFPRCGISPTSARSSKTARR